MIESELSLDLPCTNLVKIHGETDCFYAANTNVQDGSNLLDIFAAISKNELFNLLNVDQIYSNSWLLSLVKVTC